MHKAESTLDSASEVTAALSIIIPLASGETLWRQLLPPLQQQCGEEDTILLAAAEAAPPDWQDKQSGQGAPAQHWLHCTMPGRAAQMNAAAQQATNDYLWFVHADSRPAAHAVRRLKTSLRRKPKGLHYFALRFYDGGLKMKINEFGVTWRCRLFANPFGDQALCLPKTLFEQLGGYDTTAPYGEDHLLVLRARRGGNAIVPVRCTVATSARRYEQHGWWTTMRLYQKLWWQQWKQP